MKRVIVPPAPGVHISKLIEQSRTLFGRTIRKRMSYITWFQIDRPVNYLQIKFCASCHRALLEISNVRFTMSGAFANAAAHASFSSSTRDIILDAAERVFGQAGFAGGSMREISTEAGVAQALLHYHFKGKDALYREAFKRRSTVIVEYRRGKLLALFAQASPPSLEDVLGIIVTPLATIFGSAGQDSRYYLQMVAEITVATDDRSIEIVRTFYDPIGKEIAAALVRVLPGLTQQRANWAYLFAIGARLQAHAHNHRAARMGWRGGESPHEMLIPFLAAGMRAYAASPSNPAAGSRRPTARQNVVPT